jgi:hypothetical protein
MKKLTRREFIRTTGAIGTAAALGVSTTRMPEVLAKGEGMKFGLVTYLWGKDMDLPTVIDSCEKSGFQGVELRTVHAHGVEPSLSKSERHDVKKRFADSAVELVGYGSNAEYHSADPAKVKANIELTKKFIHLMHDCGATGVKVKPNNVPEGAKQDETIERIGKAFNVVGAYGADLGQEIRVEVHGRGSSELPIMKKIMEVADNPNVTVCWNCNGEDLHGKGLKHNFNLVKKRFGTTVHIRELNIGDYPYQELMNLFVKMDYNGWILLEARTDPADKVKAMTEQRVVFEKMIGRT